MINLFNQVSESYQECSENTKPWIRAVIQEEGYKEGDINYIFMSDEMLLAINKRHLNHDFYTDIITFDLSEEEKEISCEIYISTDRVMENATEYGEIYPREMHRVMIHGILHLCGYEDHTDEERNEMRAKEDYYLSKLDLNIMLES
jgi:rRNA maturation RNase YbeY